MGGATQGVQPRQLTSTPGGVTALVRAALPSLPVVGQLPGIRKAPAQDFAGLAFTRPAVTIERAHADRYADVCGFPRKDTVPLPYPHMLAFPLHMAILTDAAFPAPAIGMVHVENSITAHRPIAVGESLVVSASVGPGRPHPKGTVFEFVTTATSGGTVVWEESSTYLRRGRGDENASRGSAFPDVPPSGATWKLPADLGRTYAAVSGDRNPIHLYPWTAKALGFPRQIAHGMWSKARCLAALENRLPGAVKIDVAFRKPILLPGRVAFGSTPIEGGYAFSLTRPGSDTVHLVGQAKEL